MPITKSGLAEYDGIIAGPQFLEFAGALCSCGRPIVLVDPPEAATMKGRFFSRCPRVVDDGIATGRLAAEYLLGKTRGDWHFAYAGMKTPVGWSRRRGEAFVAQVKSLGRECGVFESGHFASSEDDSAALRKWLVDLPKPVAVFAACDPRALQVVGICKAAGLRVPEDVAVLGADDDPLLCEGSEPSISSVRMDYLSQGFMAAKMMDGLMRGIEVEREFVYGPIEVRERDTTDFTRASLPVAVKRIRSAMRANFRERITIDRLLASLGIPRRYAELQFRRATGRSMMDELLTLRMASVENLLKETDLSISEVAERSGFADEANLRRMFRARHGTGMREYRKASGVSGRSTN